MEIFMFIMFLVCNLFVVLIVKFTFDSVYSYSNGMLMGVHIPSEHVKDADVEDLLNSSKKQMRIFQNINTLLSITICFIIFWNIIIFFLAFFVWMIEYFVGISVISLSSHKKMYSIKMQNGWIIESQKRKVYIDTRVSADADFTPISYKWHFFIIAALAVCFIPFLTRMSRAYFSIIVVVFICSLLVSVFSLIFHIFMNRKERTVYSQDSKLNHIVNLTMKKYIGTSMLLMSSINAFAWIITAIMVFAAGTLSATAFYIYMFLELICVAGLIPLLMAQRRKNELLTANTEPIYIDDDEYWKTGFYYNPNDRHLFVPNRLQSGNYAINYARTGAKVFVGGITAFVVACIIFAAAVLIPFINVHIDITLSDDTLKIESAGYKSVIDINDIQTIELMEELPKDGFTKTNGGATNEYLIGHFRGNTYGKCNLYLLKGYSPILMIRTEDKTIFVNSENEGEIEKLSKALLERNSCSIRK